MQRLFVVRIALLADDHRAQSVLWNAPRQDKTQWPGFAPNGPLGPALASAGQKNRALDAMERAIRAHATAILSANAEDVAEARTSGATAAFIDRLTLTPERIAVLEAIVRGMYDKFPARPLNGRVLEEMIAEAHGEVKP